MNWQLELARWLSPAVAAYTILNALGLIFREQFQLLRLGLVKDHVIICGTGQKASLLAKRFLEYGYRVVMVEYDENVSSIEKRYTHGIIVLSGDAREKKLLYKIKTHKAKYLILFCEDDGINIEIAVNARNLIRDYSSKALTCIVHIVNPQLCHLLKEKEIGTEKTDAFRLEFFDIFDSGARYWLTELSPFKYSNKNNYQPNFLIIGLGQMGESLLLQSTKRWKDLSLNSDRKLEITVIDREAIDKMDSLKLRHPKLAEICDLIPIQMEIESPEFQRANYLFKGTQNSDITNIFICLNNDSFGLAAALVLQNQMKDSSHFVRRKI